MSNDVIQYGVWELLKVLQIIGRISGELFLIVWSNKEGDGESLTHLVNVIIVCNVIEHGV